jgi:hypothetical protein
MTTWRKSSYSGSSGKSDCVELARLTTRIGVRDSKAPEDGHLALSPRTFLGLLNHVRGREDA